MEAIDSKHTFSCNGHSSSDTLWLGQWLDVFVCLHVWMCLYKVTAACIKYLQAEPLTFHSWHFFASSFCCCFSFVHFLHYVTDSFSCFDFSIFAASYNFFLLQCFTSSTGISFISCYQSNHHLSAVSYRKQRRIVLRTKNEEVSWNRIPCKKYSHSCERTTCLHAYCIWEETRMKWLSGRVCIFIRFVGVNRPHPGS